MDVSLVPSAMLGSEGGIWKSSRICPCPHGAYCFLGETPAEPSGHVILSPKAPSMPPTLWFERRDQVGVSQSKTCIHQAGAIGARGTQSA